MLLGPFFLGKLGLSDFGIGFGSLAQVDSYSLITQVALGMAAEAAGEIIPEGRTNARTMNQPLKKAS